jgi:hypothetical protein
VTSQQSAAAAMCLVCPSARRVRGVLMCNASQANTLLHIRGKPCPEHRHPSPAGVVRWLGIDWYGVPYPVRLWLAHAPKAARRVVTLLAGSPWHDRLAALARQQPLSKPSALPGCGCIKRLKDAWINMKGYLHGSQQNRPRQGATQGRKAS